MLCVAKCESHGVVNWLINDCKPSPLQFWTKVVGLVEKKDTLQESAQLEGMSLRLAKQNNLRHYVNLLHPAVAMKPFVQLNHVTASQSGLQTFCWEKSRSRQNLWTWFYVPQIFLNTFVFIDWINFFFILVSFKCSKLLLHWKVNTRHLKPVHSG